MNMMNNKEDNDLLNKLLDIKFFSEWKSKKENRMNAPCSLELQITASCNQKCTYCYLTNFGDKLYPIEIRDEENIKNNLKLVLDWIISNNYILNSLDLFSGEIWETSFGIEILDILYEYLSKHQFTTLILIPSNASFILDENQTLEIQKRIDKFSDIGVKLVFSLSLDGLIVEDEVRPFKDNKRIRDEKFYNKVFEFAIHNSFGFHPMVAASSIEKWIDNYNWWVEMFKKYDKDISSLMMLEVRNNDWTEPKIKEYIKFINYVIDYKAKYIYKNDISEIAKDAFGLKYMKNYNNTLLKIMRNQYNCKVQNNLYIRLGDLTLTPCHRTSYERFNYGKLMVKENKIENIIAYNPSMAIKILCGNPNLMQYKCNQCAYKHFCVKGCLGAQYENSGEIFYPCSSVCDLFKAKIDFLIEKYDKMGLFDFIENRQNLDSKYYNIVNDLLYYKNKLKLEKECVKI